MLIDAILYERLAVYAELDDDHFVNLGDTYIVDVLRVFRDNSEAE